MSLISDILGSAIKDKILGSTNLSKVSSQKNTSAYTKIIGKNFMSMSSFARDMNVASQNVKKLVEIMGGKPSSKEDKVAGSGLTEDEREKKLQVLIEQETKVTPIPKEEKKPSLTTKTFDKLKATKIGKKTTSKIADLKKSFSPANIFKSLSKYLAIGALIGVIFVAFKDSFMEWASDLWETIKQSFGEFVDGIKKWFTESVQPILDKIGGFVDEFIVQPIKTFFDGFVKFIKGYFEFMYDLITNPLETIKNVWEKFKAVVDEVIDKIAVFYTSMSDKNPVKILANKLMPESVKKALEERSTAKKAKDEAEKQAEEGRKVDDSAERKKLERQQAAPKIEADETARVRKLEEEKGYKGDDEIVRARLGLPPKTETMKKEEAKVAPAAPAAPPTVTPTPAPAPAPAPAPKAPPLAPTKPAPAPISPAPAPAPTAPAKAPEKPLEVSGIQATIVKSLNDSGITSPKAHANVLATVKAESNFKVQSEDLTYSSPERIQAVFGPKRIPSTEFAQQFVKNPEALANYVYKTTDGNSAPGDGFKYRGRGFIQHTGKNQYAAISKFTGVDVLSNPDSLNSPEVAAKAIPWFLLSYKRLKPDDVENMSKVNKAIAFSDPTGKKAAERESSAQQIYASMSSGSGTQVASASTDVASGQRQQAKSQTPIVVNAPTNNTTVVNKTQVASTATRQDTGRMLAGAAA